MEAVKIRQQSEHKQKQNVDKRIKRAIEESERILAENPKLVTLEEFYQDFDNVD